MVGLLRVSRWRSIQLSHLAHLSHFSHLAQLMVAHSAPGGNVMTGRRVGCQHGDHRSRCYLLGSGGEADHWQGAAQLAGIDLYLTHRPDAPR